MDDFIRVGIMCVSVCSTALIMGALTGVLASLFMVGWRLTYPLLSGFVG